MKSVADEDLPDMFKHRLESKHAASLTTQDRLAAEAKSALTQKSKMEDSILRKTNYEIEKNRGLVRKRKKEFKNPRVKGKIKY